MLSAVVNSGGVQLFTHKVLGVLKQFATVWGQVSTQLQGTPGERAHLRRLQERHKIPELVNEMVRLGLFWVRSPCIHLNYRLSSVVTNSQCSSQ